MAKSSGFSFASLDKELSKISGFETGSLLATNSFSDVEEWIPTGNYLLNAQISGTLFGGVPNSRSFGVMGDPGTGKSFFCLNVVREAQKVGYDIIYCDTEGAIDKSTAKNFGIDLNKIRYQPIQTVSQFQTFISNVLSLVKKAKEGGGERPKILIVLDSLGMLSTDKELRDAIEGKNAADMGAKAKELRKLFRVITLDLTAAKIPLICTNHVYSGGGYLPTKESSGGDGPIFAMSVVSFLSKAQLKDNSGTKTGIVVTSTLKKSRFTVPEQVKFHISFAHGMNPYVGLHEYVSWEACGIERGKFEEVKNPETGKKESIFKPSATAQRWGVRHLNKTVASTELFTPEVFTKEVLEMLDKNVIQQKFKLPDLTDPSEVLEELSDSGLEKEVEVDEQTED
jgi:RecA/RadA recombinase